MTFAQSLIYAVPGFAACAVLALLGWRLLLQSALRRAARPGAPTRDMRLMGQSFATTSADGEFLRQAGHARTTVKLVCQVLALPIGALLIVVVLGWSPQSGLERPSQHMTALAVILAISWLGAFLMEAAIELAIATRETRMSAAGGQ